jgi:hypothetical protein
MSTAADTTMSAPPSSRTPARSIALFTLLTLLLLALQFGRAMMRDLDPDEHQFVAPPALLVQDHKLPYVDYPYFHMPDLVVIYAVLTGWTSWKLLAARTISALCGSATIALLFAAGWRWMRDVPTKSRWMIVGGIVVIFATCRLFTYTSGWAWNHDSAVFCSLAAVLLHLRGMRTGRILAIIFAGFLISLATGIRLSFALAAIPLLLSLFLSPSPLTRRQRSIALVGAFLAALVAYTPAIWLASLAPRQFFFGNLGYPALSTRYYASWNHHGMSIVGKVYSSLEKFLSDPGNAFLLLAFIATLFWPVIVKLRRTSGSSSRAEFRLILGVLVALWIGVMGPTPMQQQYNYMLVPFIALAILHAIACLLRSRPDLLLEVARGIGVAAIICGLFGARFYWKAVWLPVPSRWMPVRQHHRAQWIAEHTGPRAHVLTIETTVPLEAGLEVYPAYAVGRFILLVERFASPEDRQQYGLIGRNELPQLLATEPPDAVFCHMVDPKDQIDRPLVDYAISHGFQAVDSPDKQYRLWLRPGLSGGPSASTDSPATMPDR